MKKLTGSPGSLPDAKGAASFADPLAGTTNPKVDAYFSKNEQWEKTVSKLRTIALDFRLAEELKLDCPCCTMLKFFDRFGTRKQWSAFQRR